MGSAWGGHDQSYEKTGLGIIGGAGSKQNLSMQKVFGHLAGLDIQRVQSRETESTNEALGTAIGLTGGTIERLSVTRQLHAGSGHMILTPTVSNRFQFRFCCCRRS